MHPLNTTFTVMLPTYSLNDYNNEKSKPIIRFIRIARRSVGYLTQSILAAACKLRYSKFQTPFVSPLSLITFLFFLFFSKVDLRYEPNDTQGVITLA